MSSNEKYNGSGTSSRISLFHLCLEEAHLMCISQHGPAFTGTNNKKNENAIFERIYMAFCNLEWLQAFPSSTVIHSSNSSL